LPKDEQVLLIEGIPRRCRQARYYSDEYFAPSRS
jgi:type IV secretory pathway TraG/TraD family ATPase VirD4